MNSTPMEFRRLPRSPTLPESWRACWMRFVPRFAGRARSRCSLLLATGLVTQTTRRTVVGMLAGAGMAAVVSFHAVCRFFSHHALDIDRLGLVLARLIVARLLAADAAIDVVVDDTLFRRWGPQGASPRSGPTTAPRRTPTRSAAATGGSSSGSSSRCRSAAHPVCLPVLLRLWRGKGTASPVELAGELISILAQVFPDRLCTPSGTPPTTARRCWCPLPRSPPGARPTPPSTRGAAAHRQAVLEIVQNAATSGASRYSICSSEGDTSVRSAVASAIAGVLIAARGPDAEALSGLASSARSPARLTVVMCGVVPCEHVEAEVGLGIAPYGVRVVGATLSVVPLDEQPWTLQPVVVWLPGLR